MRKVAAEITVRLLLQRVAKWRVDRMRREADEREGKEPSMNVESKS